MHLSFYILVYISALYPIAVAFPWIQFYSGHATSVKYTMCFLLDYNVASLFIFDHLNQTNTMYLLCQYGA